MKFFELTAEFNIPPLRDESRIVTFVNPTNFYQTHAIWHEFDQIFSDGILFTKLYSWRYGIKIERISFDFGSIASQVFEHASRNHFRVALIGGKPSEISEASARIRRRFPEMCLCYESDGFRDRQQILNELVEAKVDLLVVGLGSPLQENFLLECKSQLPGPFLGYSCGGFLTQTSMADNYYPVWVNRWNLRWLFRFVKHSHVRRKVLVEYPIFLFRWFTTKLAG